LIVVLPVPVFLNFIFFDIKKLLLRETHNELSKTLDSTCAISVYALDIIQQGNI